MKRFKKILFVLDRKKNTDVALKRAIKLTEENRAVLTVVGVIERLPSKLKKLLKTGSYSELERAAIEERLKQIQEIIKRVKKRDVKVNVKVLLGKPYIEIIREVMRNKHDLVMKIVEKEVGHRDILFGSDDINLMRKCPSPVWMVKPHRGKKYTRILAAVDPDPYDKQRNELDNMILELATSLARLEQSDLHVVHAWGLYCENILTGPRFRVTKSEVTELLQVIRKNHKEWIDELLEKFGSTNFKPKVHLIKGVPWRIITDIAKKVRAELIVMGTVCRTGLPGILIGNTAETVLRQVDCSVLTVKPEGFVSPVSLEE